MKSPNCLPPRRPFRVFATRGPKHFLFHEIGFPSKVMAAMRMIGHLADESTARRFGDFLYVQGIENELEQQNASGWGVWINDEDKIQGATALLDTFRRN